MRTLLQVISDYDRDQQLYIEELEAKIEQLQKKNGDLVNQLVSYVATVDRMKLDLILGGALQRPSAPSEQLAAVSRRMMRLEDALRFYADEDERNGWGGRARVALEEGEQEVSS